MSERPTFQARIADADDDPCVVELVGELDMSTAPEFDAVLDVVVTRGTDVVIDCAQLTFIDSSGINALVRAHHQLGERVLRVRNVPDQMHRVLKLTKLVELFALE
jgi:anti-sigma B factor antagonist